MTEETKTVTDEGQLADPYNAKALELATQAITAVSNIISMVANSGNEAALGLFIFMLMAEVELLWEFAQKKLPAEVIEEAEEIKAKAKIDMAKRLEELISIQGSQVSSNHN